MKSTARKKKASRKPTRSAPTWPSKASVFEVSPRDGLQSEHKILSVDERVELIRLLVNAGMPDIEVGSFVKADRIPQLQNTAQVVRDLKAKGAQGKSRFWAFIPNDHGLSQAIGAGLDGASFFSATSDTFCQRNVNRTQAEILRDLGPLLKKARQNGLKSRVYLSTLVYCPYEGEIGPKKVYALAAKLVDLGAKEIVLSDTTGHANPKSLAKVLAPLVADFAPSLFALHLHDTRGLALANILEATRFGLSRFDSSVGGTGGCPYAPGASGNLATEDLVYMLQGMGSLKGIDLSKLGEAGRFVQSLLGRELPSRVLKTLGATK